MSPATCHTMKPNQDVPCSQGPSLTPDTVLLSSEHARSGNCGSHYEKGPGKQKGKQRGGETGLCFARLDFNLQLAIQSKEVANL